MSSSQKECTRKRRRANKGRGRGDHKQTYFLNVPLSEFRLNHLKRSFYHTVDFYKLLRDYIQKGTITYHQQIVQ